MSLRSLFVIAALFFTTHIFGETTHYFTISEDTKHAVVFPIPEEWKAVEENTIQMYDLRLQNRADHRECLFLFGYLDDQALDAELLRVLSQEIKDEYYAEGNISDHSIASGKNSLWETFNVTLDDQQQLVGIGIYPIENFVIGLVVINPSDFEMLQTDFEMMKSKIHLIDLE